MSVQALMDLVFFVAAGVVSTTFVAWPLIQRIAPILLEAVVTRIPDRRMASATSIVSNAALVASGHTVDAMFRFLQEAKDAASPGGASVTPDEWRSIVAKGVAVGWKTILDQGPMAVSRVVGVYGSEDTARSAISAKVTSDMFKATERSGVGGRVVHRRGRVNGDQKATDVRASRTQAQAQALLNRKEA